MRVVYFSHGDGKYGAPKSLSDLVLQLEKNYRIIPVIVTSRRNELNLFCDKVGIENYAIYYADCLYGYEKERSFFQTIRESRVLWKMKWRHFYYNPRAIAKIEKLIDFTKVSIIHSNVSTIDVGAIIAAKYGIPHIWHIREYGISDFYSFKAFAKNYIKYITDKSYRVICISEFVKQNWKKMGLLEEKVDVVYDVVKQPVFYPHLVEKSNVKILFCGSSTPAKGLMDLLIALFILKNEGTKNFKLSIYGDYTDSYGHQIMNWVEKNQLNKYIKFCGFDEQLNKKMCIYDIGVVCSRSEAFGRITVEYMEAGLCLVASDTGANPELIGNRDVGILYRYGDSSDLAAKLRGLLKSDYDMEKMKEYARNYALEQFNEIVCAKKIYKIYKSALQELTMEQKNETNYKKKK